ncbi:MAG: hypothetical protein NC311_09925 [Muribaculaceae bacterium]|nr:hypothetical protein [Muribaculaceae bacterium]
MEKQNKILSKCERIIAIAAALLLLLLASCTKTVYIPTESAAVRTDTLAVLKWRTDTVIDRDTVTVTQSGDTITREVTKWRWRIKETHDTVYQSKTDTIRVREPYPVEVVKEVERKRSWWETFLLYATGVSIIICIIFALLKNKVRK